MVDFGADFFHGLVPIFSRFARDFSRFARDINGEKKISLSMSFFTVSFSRFAPLLTNSNMFEDGSDNGNS